MISRGISVVLAARTGFEKIEAAASGSHFGIVGITKKQGETRGSGAYVDIELGPSREVAISRAFSFDMSKWGVCKAVANGPAHDAEASNVIDEVWVDSE